MHCSDCVLYENHIFFKSYVYRSFLGYYVSFIVRTSTGEGAKTTTTKKQRYENEQCSSEKRNRETCSS